MEFADSALLADMIVEWRETPLCTLNYGMENLQAPQELSNVMDAMLVDIGLPEVISTPEPPYPVAKPGGLPALVWPCSEGAPPVADVSDALVKLPFFAQKGATSEEDSPPSAPFPSRAVIRQTWRAIREPTCKAKVPAIQSRKRAGADQVKECRSPGILTEHVIRERRRRDDMAAKYGVLESLLPPASKRERAVVVEDAALLVKAMQRKKLELLKRRAALKLLQTAAPDQHAPRSLKKIRRVHNTEAPGTISGYNLKQEPGALLALLEYNSSEPHPTLCSSGGAVGEAKRLNTKRCAASAINVYTGEGGLMVVEVAWNRPCPNFQSSLLQAVESLGSEVTRCSMLRVATGFLHCLITCSNPQVPSQLKAERQAPEALIIGALTKVLKLSS